MLLSFRSGFLAVVSAFLLCFAASPAQASTQVLSTGYGSYLASNQTSVLEFSYAVTQRNGVVQGLGIWQGPGSVTVFRVDSAVYLSDGETLAFAGVVVAIFGTPPPNGATVGGTVFTAFQDNGFGPADQTVSLSAVPPGFGNLTAQQIIGLIGEPPPQAFRPLLTGNVWIR